MVKNLRVSYKTKLGGKSERKRPFGRLKRRWKNNIKMDLKGVRM
jgi:hypothetical protein